MHSQAVPFQPCCNADFPLRQNQFLFTSSPCALGHSGLDISMSMSMTAGGASYLPAASLLASSRQRGAREDFMRLPFVLSLRRSQSKPSE